MSSERTAAALRTPGTPGMEKILEQYGCGPIRFTGTGDALYERHLMFDNVLDAATLGARERYEAAARSVRDVLSQRWLRTESTYERENPKRVYYLSMEFLIGRSLANNITNLLLDPLVQRAVERPAASTGWRCSSRSPTPAWATAGSAASRRASSTRWRRCSSRPWATGCATSTASSGRRSRTAGSASSRTTGCAGPTPGRSPARRRAVEIKLGCSFEVRGGSLGVVAGRPSSLLGLPFDRPVVGYGGKTINTLRLWAAGAPDVFDFQAFSAGEFVSALAERLTRRIPDARPLPRRLDEHGAGAALRAGVLPRRLLARRPRAALPPPQSPTGARCPTRSRSSSTTPIPSLAVPELMRILLDEARLGWDEAWDLTRRTLAYTNHTLLPEALEKWPLRWFELLLPRQLEIILEIDRRLARGGAEPLPGRRGPRRAREPRRGGRRAQDPHGQPRDRRLAQHQRRRRDPFRAAAHGDGQGPRRDVPRALQQQDQRRDAAALAAAGQPGARRAASPRRSATAGSPTSPSSRS